MRFTLILHLLSVYMQFSVQCSCRNNNLHFCLNLLSDRELLLTRPPSALPFVSICRTSLFFLRLCLCWVFCLIVICGAFKRPLLLCSLMECYDRVRFPQRLLCCFSCFIPSWWISLSICMMLSVHIWCNVMGDCLIQLESLLLRSLESLGITPFTV